jgi:hypothetical protein
MKKNIYLLLFTTLVSIPFAQAQTKKKVKTKTEVKTPKEDVRYPEGQEITVEVTPEAPAVKTIEDFAQTITADDLSKHLHVLASDAYEGRETGKKGQKMAADYISQVFWKNNLTGPVTDNTVNPYFQSFNLEQATWKKASLQAGKTTYAYQKDFFLFGDSPDQPSQKLDLVFAGYGIEDKVTSDNGMNLKVYSDYENLDVKDKTVIVLAGEPMDKAGNFLISKTKEPSAWGEGSRLKARTAIQKGAKNILVIETSDVELQKSMDNLRHWLESPTVSIPGKDRKNPTIFVSQAVGAALLQTTPKKLLAYQSEVTKNEKPVAGKFKPAKEVELKAEKARKPLSTENVLGFLEGTDKKDEVLVITAHYDHIGMDPNKTGDKIFNGADDDGSGTSAVLELAQAFAEARKAGVGPRRSILFMTVTGEEKGLLGSEYYTQNPVFPLANTIADLNIDMIGRLDEKHATDKNYVYVIGSDKLSSDLHYISEDANRKYTKLQLDYTFNDENDPNKFYYRSDHYNFAKNNIPVAFYFNGVHEDYHKETDEVGKILFDKMEKITRLVFYTAWELANRDERIKVDSNKK